MVKGAVEWSRERWSGQGSGGVIKGAVEWSREHNSFRLLNGKHAEWTGKRSLFRKDS
jgi:hypothetical protein